MHYFTAGILKKHGLRLLVIIMCHNVYSGIVPFAERLSYPRNGIADRQRSLAVINIYINPFLNMVCLALRPHKPHGIKADQQINRYCAVLPELLEYGTSPPNCGRQLLFFYPV